MKWQHRGLIAVAVAFGLVFALGLSACNGQSSSGSAASEAASSEAASSEATVSSEAASDASTEAASDASADDAMAASSEAMTNEKVDPAGEPWDNTTWSTTVPEQKPEEVDDLYLSVTYDWLKEAKETGMPATRIQEDAGAIKNSLLKAVEDKSVTGNGLDQLRIFYAQAIDFDARSEQGYEPIKVYTDKIMATKSLDELNALLVSGDFPFSPWINLGVSNSDKRETNLASITPNMLYSDIVLTGGDPYQDWEDPDKAASAQQMITIGTLTVSTEAIALGVEQGQVQQVTQDMFALEKSYGKEIDTTSALLTSGYGEEAKYYEPCTMEELEKAFSNFPIKELLARYGKDKSEKYVAENREWIEPFNALWTDENFETLRLMTAIKVLDECKAILEPDFAKLVLGAQGMTEDTPEDIAYLACNQLNTFSDVIAQNYVENTIGKDGVERMTKISGDLIDTYKTLINETTWFEDESRAKILEKLDNMTLNVLYPESGYCDYSNLELKTSEEGGTLLSNYLAIKEYKNEQENTLIGKPATADTPWRQVAPTELNCFYDFNTNSINILPGYINRANYFEGMSDEEIMGTLATTIGHEISHGFDYVGSQYDAYGVMNLLFVGDDAQNFVDHRDKLAAYYSTITYDAEGDKVDGIDKSAEAAADLCGVQVVLEYAESIDDFDYKTFFESYANQWAASYPPMYASTIISDTHPLSYLRSNVNAQMFDEFYEAFDVKEGDEMYLEPEKRTVIWGEAA